MPTIDQLNALANGINAAITKPCKCIDCGGDQPNHSNDCAYMLELHGDVAFPGPSAAIPDNEDLILWPDGTQCFRHELSGMTFMSDDYEVIPFGTPRFDQLTQE